MILKQSTSLFIKELTLDPCPKNKNCWHRWHFVFFKIQKNPQNFCVFLKYFEQVSTNILPKDWSEMKMTNVFSKISLVKSSNFFFYFFVCILPDYLSHESSKEFWKKRHFENMGAGFLRRCQNSLRQNSHEIIHF